MSAPSSPPAPSARDELDLLLRRRSVSRLDEPGPSGEQLDRLLAAATSVPDHGLLRPWRFVVVTGPARATFGAALAESARQAGVAPEAVEKARAKPLLAPTQVVVLAAPVDSPKVPEWEQVASAACTGYALMLAAEALGLGAVWKSTPYRDGDSLRALLGLAGRDQLLGWINLGRAEVASLPERAAVRPEEVAGVLGLHGALQPYRPVGG